MSKISGERFLFFFYRNPTFTLFMKKALATFIDIYYQLLLYYIAKLKDSFKVYCYENVQNYMEWSESGVLDSLLVI